MPTVSCQGRDLALYCTETGRGDPLIFLNGLAGDHLYWMGQLRALSGQFRCVALDNRDSGQSPYVTDPYTIADLADDVAGLMATLQLPPAHVVGLSLGGMIAQELALRHLDQVRSLFLVGTVARSDEWFMSTLNAFGLIRNQVANSPEFFVALLPWLVSHRFFQFPERVEWLRVLLRQNPHPQRLEGFVRQLEAVRGHDTLNRLSSIRCPVFVATGEDDMIAPPRYAKQLVAGLPNARLAILPGIGHAPPIEDGRGFKKVLRDFLQELPRKTVHSAAG